MERREVSPATTPDFLSEIQSRLSNVGDILSRAADNLSHVTNRLGCGNKELGGAVSPPNPPGESPTVTWLIGRVEEQANLLASLLQRFD
jgi:hypothetical protein